MNRLALLSSLWLAQASCGAATGLDVPRPDARDDSSDTTGSGGVSSEPAARAQSGTSAAESSGSSSAGGGSSSVNLVAGSMNAAAGGSNATSPTTSVRDCSHVVNDGGGGAHTVASEVCCQCGWPEEGPLCQAVLQILPYSHSADDERYYSCIGGEVPFCILDHLDTCANGFPMECFEAYANQVACLAEH